MNAQVFSIKNVYIVVVIILLIIAISTNNWMNISLNFNNIHIGNTSLQRLGLWSTLNNNNLLLQLTKNFIILSLISAIIGLYLVIKTPEYKFNYIFFIVSGCLSILSALMYKIYISSYTSVLNNTSVANSKIENKLGYSWYLNLLAGIASLVLSMLIKKIFYNKIFKLFKV